MKMSNKINEIQKIFDDNGVTNYNIKMGDDVRKKGSVPRDTKKKLTWIIDENVPDNELILVEYDDPAAFLHTDKTPEEVETIVRAYMKANNIQAEGLTF
jgi:hypothetical protein